MKKLLFYTFILINLIHPKISTTQQITIFGHGIVDSSAQIERFKEAIATPHIQSINFPDSLAPAHYNPITNLTFAITSYLGKNMNYGSMFMGQKDDIDTLQKEINACGDDECILFGCSRASATIVSCLGKNNPKNVKALVLDACPASMPETITMTLAQLGINPAYNNAVFSSIFPLYDPVTALTPLQAIATIENKDLPILLLHSKEDKIVPYIHALKLYQTFKKYGFNNVHLALFDKGRHSFLIQNPETRHDYLKVVHSFYKKYGLPYNPEFGSDELSDTPLSQEEINETIKRYDELVTETYNYMFQRNLGFAVAIIGLILLYQNSKLN